MVDLILKNIYISGKTTALHLPSVRAFVHVCNNTKEQANSGVEFRPVL